MLMMHQKPTVYIPPWSSLFDVAGGDPSFDEQQQQQQQLSSFDLYDDLSDDEINNIDAYSCDEFRMYEFKIRRCARGRSHDWTECPFAHPGEKARRRDPRKYHYSGTACPDFRKGCCKRGDACDMAHGVFECWLHPARYRTQPCKDGTACRRRVCFFAHTPEQLRVLPQSPKTPLEYYDGSPLRRQRAASSAMSATAATSPPMSPTAAAGDVMSMSTSPVNEVLASLRKLQLEKVKSMPGRFGVGVGFGLSPRAAAGGFCSLPSTPTRDVGLDGGFGDEEEHVERVESGRALRARLYERLSKESGMDFNGHVSSGSGPDVGWVSELVK